MPLPIDFQFSQNILQDYVDCPRRFELRYILRQQWPALPSEPVAEHERRLELGSRLHEMIHQHLTGIPANLIEAQVDDPQLFSWWYGYLSSSNLPSNISHKSSESFLSCSMAGSRIVARFDLVVFTTDYQVSIYDWKTSTKRLSRQFLQDRMQSRVYPCLLSSAGRFPDGSRIDPQQIKMTYWFSNFPDDPEVFLYSVNQYQSDLELITGLIKQIHQTEPGRFLLTPHLKACSYCVYRSLCDRGTEAGDWSTSPDESEITPAISMDFEQVAEVEF